MAGTTTVGGRLAIAALTDLSPYLALLTADPGEWEDPISGDILAVECAADGYERLLVTNWQQNTEARPPYSYNFDSVSATDPVTGSSPVITHFALVENGSGATGDIYSVGQLLPPKVLVEDQVITIAANKIRIIAP